MVDIPNLPFTGSQLKTALDALDTALGSNDTSITALENGLVDLSGVTDQSAAQTNLFDGVPLPQSLGGTGQTDIDDALVTPTNGSEAALKTLLEGIQHDPATDTPAAPMVMRYSRMPYIVPEWWNFASGNTAGTNATELAKAIVASQNDNKPIRPQGGVRTIDPITVTMDTTSKDFALLGPGKEVCTWDFGTNTQAIAINFTTDATQMDGDKSSIRVYDMGFQTQADATATAIRIDYPDARTGTGAGTSNLREVVRCSFSGSNPNAHRWLRAVHITNSTLARILHCDMYGRNAGAGVWYAGELVRLDGTKNSVMTFIWGNTATLVETLLRGLGTYEGIECIGNHANQVRYGAVIQASLADGNVAQPHFSWIGGHVNAAQYCWFIDNMSEVTLDCRSCYLQEDTYINGGVTDPTVALIRRTGASEGFGGSSFNLVTRNPFDINAITGVDLGAWCGDSHVNGQFFGADIPVRFRANCNSCTGMIKETGTKTTAVRDGGTSNVVYNARDLNAFTPG